MDKAIYAEALAVLDVAAAELAEIRRGRHYMFWREENEGSLDRRLSALAPFRNYLDAFILAEAENNQPCRMKLGSWVIAVLLSKKSGEAVIEAFLEQVARNFTEYTELSPVLGVSLDEECVIEDGLTLQVPPVDSFSRSYSCRPFTNTMLPEGTAFVAQPFILNPAFSMESDGTKTAAATPNIKHRDRARRNVRLACLLSSEGPVQIPASGIRPENDALFALPMQEAPRRLGFEFEVSTARASDVRRAYSLLSTYKGFGKLERAIDALGRSRAATRDVDRAAFLGLAAEIVLMHDQDSENTEISHKLGTRAAWLLGETSQERATIFKEIKKLYGARSQSVHTGVLSSKKMPHFPAADRIVQRILLTVLGQGEFPDWNKLTLGG